MKTHACQLVKGCWWQQLPGEVYCDEIQLHISSDWYYHTLTSHSILMKKLLSATVEQRELLNKAVAQTYWCSWLLYNHNNILTGQQVNISSVQMEIGFTAPLLIQEINWSVSVPSWCLWVIHGPLHMSVMLSFPNRPKRKLILHRNKSTNKWFSRRMAESVQLLWIKGKSILKYFNTGEVPCISGPILLYTLYVRHMHVQLGSVISSVWNSTSSMMALFSLFWI